DGRTVNGRHDRFRALDDVADEVAGFAHHPETNGVVVAHHLVDQLEAPARGERLAGTGQERDARVGVAVDRRPHVGELAVHVGTDGIESGRVEHDVQYAVAELLAPQGRVRGIEIGHRAGSSAWPGGAAAVRSATSAERFSLPAGLRGNRATNS